MGDVRAAHRVGVFTATCLAGLLAACSAKSGNSPPPHTATVTVKPSSTHPSASASPTRTAPPKPALVRTLPGDCDGLLSLFDIQQATGLPLPGKTAFVVGVPEKNIGRLAYINCRYGLAAAQSPPQLEIGVSLYITPEQAATRLRGTVEDYASHGATPRSMTVAGHSATLLAGASGQGYDVPLLVVGSGQRTVAVSLANGVTSAARQLTVMSKVAALALQRTGG